MRAAVDGRKVLVMTLPECGTHATTAAQADPVTAGEAPMAAAPASAPGRPEPGRLVMADRDLYSYEVITAVTAAGADFRIRVKAGPDLPVRDPLPDGSYRAYVADRGIRNLASVKARLAFGAMAPGVMPCPHVRVADYDVPGRGNGEVFIIATSVLDHQDMTAADQAELDPGRLSFTRILNIVRRQVTARAAFPPPASTVPHLKPPPRFSRAPAPCRHRTCSRVIERGRHNSYRIKRKTDTITRHHGPPEVRIYAPAT